MTMNSLPINVYKIIYILCVSLYVCVRAHCTHVTSLVTLFTVKNCKTWVLKWIKMTDPNEDRQKQIYIVCSVLVSKKI